MDTDIIIQLPKEEGVIEKHPLCNKVERLEVEDKKFYFYDSIEIKAKIGNHNPYGIIMVTIGGDKPASWENIGCTSCHGRVIPVCGKLAK